MRNIFLAGNVQNHDFDAIVAVWVIKNTKVMQINAVLLLFVVFCIQENIDLEFTKLMELIEKELH